MTRASVAAVAVCFAALLVSCGSSLPLTDIDRADASRDACDDCAVDGPIDAPVDEVDPRPRGTAELGVACASGADCASSFCADGVCCEDECASPCRSCALEQHAGTCLLAEVGSDPREECNDEGIASCGRDGACDGSGACRRYPTGSICREPTCTGATLTQAFRCAGDGACALTSGQPCDPYLCAPNGAKCLNSCVTSNDCVPGRVCENGKCGKNPLGAPCAEADDCNSNICQQEVCCAAACTGTCQSCALIGSAGSCTNVPAGQDPLAQCTDETAASCGTNGSCNGLGACQIYPATAVCIPASCAGPLFTAAGFCDGARVCHGGASASCGLYQCTVAGCRTTCTTAADCMAPNICVAATCGAPTNLTLQYLCRAPNAAEQGPKPSVQLTNLAATPVPLSQITIRYWYTSDGTQAQSVAIDYADLGKANITGRFVRLAVPRVDADSYLELGFIAAAGSLAGGGASTGQIQVRFNKADFSLYNQSNDYSFDATKVDFADWNRITVYRLGTLVSGVEPAAR